MSVKTRLLLVGCANLALACGGGASPAPPADASADGAAGDAAAPDGGSTSSDAGDAGGPDASTITCQAAETASCACPAAAIGTRYCLPAGSGFGDCVCTQYGDVIYVSPSGTTSATGTEASPLSLDGARDAARAKVAAGLKPGGLAVVLTAGTYERATSLALGTTDSGPSADVPVVYRSAPGATVRMTGGKVIAPAAFAPVPTSSPVYPRLDATVAANVLQVDLKSLGITDFGQLARRGFCAFGQIAALELSFDGAPMQLARWPDANDNTFPTSLETATQLQLFGTVTPDVTGTWAKEGTQDGVTSFGHQGLIGGKQYHLYRYQWDYNGGHYQAWFITTQTTGYPSNTDPWWSVYSAKLAAFAPSAGATGNVTTTDPTWVNHGFTTVAKALSNTNFAYVGTHPGRLTTAPDLWLHGMFEYDWADCHTPATVDATTGSFTLPQSPGYGIVDGQPYYVENALEEITVPGEYYVDRTAGVLYFLPPAPLVGHEVVVSMLTTPILSVTNAQNLTVDGVTFESARATLVNVSGGSNVLLSHVRFLNAGTDAVTISGTNNGISNCEISGSGAGGVTLSGGDRKSLTHGSDYVENCRIHDFSRFEFMYHPGVSLNGAGQRASHNLIYSAPHSAILYGGNEHLLELNEIHHVVQKTSDAGAIYSGRDWGARGNVLRNNFIHDVASIFQGYGVHGIYLDDCLSGIEVRGNIVYNVTGHGILHGGGRDNVMVNNIIAHSGDMLSADSRCVDWLANGTPNNTPGDSWNLLEKLENVGYQQDPWLTKYPTCAAIPYDWPTVSAPGSHWLKPEGCTFEDNVGLANGQGEVGSSATFGAYASNINNLSDAGVLFTDEATMDLTIRSDSPAMALPNFQAPPFHQMGLSH